MRAFDPQFPLHLRELHKRDFDYADGNGIDFEPYQEFMSAEETRDWLRAWTGNPSLDGLEFRVFGQDGTGGKVAFWCLDEDDSVLDQPIVFLGSEGALGVVACNFWDYLWLLADGVGPMEAVEYPGLPRAPQPAFLDFATKHAADSCATPEEIRAKARAAHPDFVAMIDGLIR